MEQKIERDDTVRC